MEVGYFLIGMPLCFGIGYIVGTLKSEKPTDKETEKGITITRSKSELVNCVGYRGGRKCDRKTSKYSITGLCNRCDDARFGY